MQFTHLDENGQANMVDVSDKPVTERTARAKAVISMNQYTFKQIKDNQLKKGDALSVARIAGIQAAKQTSALIPLCHPLMLTKISIDFTFDEAESAIIITSFCKLAGQTGVEIEALTAASIAAITIYDMCKALDKCMTIDRICVLEKVGGQSGDYLL